MQRADNCYCSPRDKRFDSSLWVKVLRFETKRFKVSTCHVIFFVSSSSLYLLDLKRVLLSVRNKIKKVFIFCKNWRRYDLNVLSLWQKKFLITNNMFYSYWDTNISNSFRRLLKIFKIILGIFIFKQFVFVLYCITIYSKT